MTHVKISKQADSEAISVFVDGVDMSNSVLRDGFKVTMPVEWCDVPRVHVVIPADVLEVDLPDAVLDAIHREPDGDATEFVAAKFECPSCKASGKYEIRVAEVDPETAAAYAEKMREATK